MSRSRSHLLLVLLELKVGLVARRSGLLHLPLDGPDLVVRLAGLLVEIGSPVGVLGAGVL